MKNLVVLLFIVINWQLQAQNSPEIIIDNFFETFKTQKEKAIRDLYDTNPWAKKAQPNIDNLIKVVNGLTLEFIGQYYGYELLDKKNISNKFIIYTYIVYYDRQPLRFQFKFYKPGKKWKLHEFNMNDKFDDKKTND
jgi:hypothetical protein